MPDQFLNRAQVAAELGVSPWSVYRLIRLGELRALRIGRRGLWRVSREELEAYANLPRADSDDSPLVDTEAQT